MKNCNHNNDPETTTANTSSSLPLADHILNNLKLNKDLNNDFIKNIVKNDSATLEEELYKIDQEFQKDMETFDLMEENNLEVLKSLNLDKSTNLEKLQNLSMNKKFEKILDNKMIIDSLKPLEKYEKENEQTTISEQDKIKRLLTSKLFFLNDKKITKIANLEIYENLEELYLQRNFIKQIENLKYLKNLQILNLSNNYIRRIENIDHLENLQVLDLSDNLIGEFHIDKLPVNIVYLYLFDNLFYDDLNLLKFRSMCIRHLKDLIRLDCLSITDKERLMLIDESNLKNKRRLLILESKLKYIKLHYEESKRERRTLLREFEESYKTNTNSEDKLKEGVFVTKNIDISSFKKRSQERVKLFEGESDERMKDLKGKLEEIRNKFRSLPIMADEERKDKIKEKINTVIKFEEKMKIAEEINKKIDQREEAWNKGMTIGNQRHYVILNNDDNGTNINMNTNMNTNMNMNMNQINEENSEHNITENNITQNNISQIDHTNNNTHTEEINQTAHNKTHNSLLTDMSDLSFINKNPK